jgi:hypothetical protein
LELAVNNIGIAGQRKVLVDDYGGNGGGGDLVDGELMTTRGKVGFYFKYDILNMISF